jgi:RING finger protein 113A
MEDPQITPDVPEITFKKRSKAKASFRKRPATPPLAVDSSSGYSSSDGEGHRIKRRRKTAGFVAASSKGTPAPQPSETLEPTTTDRSTTIASTNDATKQSNWYDEGDLSAKKLLGTTRTRPSADNDAPADGTYKGASSYGSFIAKNPNAPSRQVGPVKAPTNIRTITVTDFAPDVCKDYKQTGFCGFGDNCKFLHAREDYKQGWELDRDWEIGTKGKKVTGRTVASANREAKAGEEDDEDDEALLESIPFACIICKKPYTNPIITKCGHYFCESCALGRYRKNPSCVACGAGTGGVFNVAKKLGKLLERKRERAQQRRDKAREDGEEVSSGTEEGED